MGEPETSSFWMQTRGLTRPFWVANCMETIERLAYYGVRVVIPIYIAQADEIGGLHFSQSDKGFIFLWWALVQSILPVLTGGFAERYGYKRQIALIFLPPSTHCPDATRGSVFRGHAALDTVPNNLDLMAGRKLAAMAVNLAGRADSLQFFPAP